MVARVWVVPLIRGKPEEEQKREREKERGDLEYHQKKTITTYNSGQAKSAFCIVFRLIYMMVTQFSVIITSARFLPFGFTLVQITNIDSVSSDRTCRTSFAI